MFVPAFAWNTFWHYVWPPEALRDPLIARGLWTTVYIAVTAQVLGVLLGLLLAFGQRSRRWPVRRLTALYVLYFRGTPVLVQLSLIYFGAAALGIYAFSDLHVLGLTIPGVAQAGIIGLGLNEAAFMAEIFRAGIASIDPGQTEAAKTIGMTNRQVMRHVVLPQAARVIVPPLGNEFNNMMKNTTLVVTIGGVELFSAFEQVNARTFQPFELFLAVSFYYLVLTLLWSLVQRRLEARLGDRKISVRRQGVVARTLRIGLPR